MGLLPNLVTDEIKRLSPQIEKAIITRLPNFLNDPETINWMKANGLNGRKDPLKTIARLAAFSVVLKLIIVESIRENYKLPSLGSSRLSELDYFFGQVNHVVGLNLLPHSLLDNLIQLLPLSTRPIEEKAQKALELLKENEEDMSNIYNAILLQEERRKMGQFWTPDYIADFMVSWVLKTPNDKLLEPGTGPGIFLLKGIQRLEKLGKKRETMHENLFGIELGFVPYLMGTANLLSRIPSANGNITYGDFLLAKPKNAPILDNFIFSVETSTFDAIVFNPPYTRHHLLPSIYKKCLLPSFVNRFGIEVSRLSSLFVYFIFHALSFLKQQGRMAFITPTIVFESRKSKALKELLKKNASIRAIISFSDKINVFPGVDAAACITLIENSSEKNQEVVLMEIMEWPGKERILEALNDATEGEWEWGKIRRIPLAKLDPDKNWVTLVKSDNLIIGPKSAHLGELAYIVRGIATGANDFFTLTDKEIEERGIQLSFLKPIIRRTRDAQGFVFSREDFNRLGEEGKKRWLLYCIGYELDQLKGTNVGRYIKDGEKAGFNERSLVQTRRRWYEVEQREIPPILYTYLSRRRARFILNRAGVLALNVFILVYPHDDICKDETTLKAFLAVLNSGIVKNSLRQVGRSYGGDSIKLEPRTLDEVLVVDPRKLTLDEKTKLAELFDKLCEESKKQGEEEIKHKIDQLLLEYMA